MSPVLLRTVEPDLECSCCGEHVSEAVEVRPGDPPVRVCAACLHDACRLIEDGRSKPRRPRETPPDPSRVARGHARAAAMSPEHRSAVARKAAQARWKGREETPA